MANKQRDVEKARFWRRTISVQRGSGLSIRAFCAREQLSEPSFYAWRRALAQREVDTAPSRKRSAVRRSRRYVTPAFVNLTASEAVPWGPGVFRPGPALELVHPRGHVLRIAPSCDPQTLSMVLSALSVGGDEAARC